MAERSHRLYWALGPAALLAYWLLREHFVGMERQNFLASNLSVNLVIMMALWFGYCEALTNAVYVRAIRRTERGRAKMADRLESMGKELRAPRWMSWAVLMVMVVAMIYYLTFWGFETRW